MQDRPECPDSLETVLSLVRNLGSVTRLQLTETSGLSRKVVSQRLDELLDRGLVVEGPPLESTGGRAPRSFEFCPTAGHLIAVEFGATGVAVGLADLSARVVDEIIESADLMDTADERVARVEDLIEVLLARNPACRQIRGLGVGVFCTVDARTGLPNEELNVLGWGGYPIRQRWQNRYGVPVRVDNEVNMMAVGELRRGAARGHSTVLQVKVGSGIGAGIIVDGSLVRGVRGMAGEIGHIRVAGGTARCVCGGVGCLAVEAGGIALARQATEAAARSPHLSKVLADTGRLTAKDLGTAAAAGDPLSRELLGTAARRIGEALAGVVTVLDPSIVIIGGGVAGAGRVVLGPIEQAIRSMAVPSVVRGLTIEHSTRHDHMGLVGAASSVAGDVLSSAGLAQWGGPALAVG